MKDSFGSRLKALRQKHELTQEALGKILNVTNVGVAKWESNDRFPDKETLVKIADYFNTSIDYLLCRTDIYEGNINGDNIKIEYEKEAYPDGLTHDQVIDILKKLKEAGVNLNPNDKKPE